MWMIRPGKIVQFGDRVPNVEHPSFQVVDFRGSPVTVYDANPRAYAMLAQGYKDFPLQDGLHYCGPLDPMDHQRQTVEFLVRYSKAYVANGLGTGKTLSAFWAAEFLRDAGLVRRVLVVAPKSAMIDAWGNCFSNNAPLLDYAILTGSAEKKREAADDLKNTYLVVNPESLEIIADHLPNVDLVIADEATKFKTWKANRTKQLNKIAKGKRLWMMSATPAPQNPTDAYAQVRCLREGKYISFTAFRDLTMRQVNQFKWVARPNAMQTVAQELQPCIRFSRDECLDLPDMQIIDKQIELTPQQTKALKTMQDAAFAQIDTSTITAVNAAAVMTKSLQIMAGVVYGEPDAEGNKPAVKVDTTNLVESILDIVEQTEHGVIIYATFRSSVQLILDALKAQGIIAEGIIADVSTKERAEIFKRIQSGDTKVLVAVAQTISHGVTLTKANTIIWVTPPLPFEVYDQANGRIYRKGQKNKCLVYRFFYDNVSRNLIKRLDTRDTLQNTLLNILSKKSC